MDIQRAVAHAWIAHTDGDTAQAEQLLRMAADREDATEESAVTPGLLVRASRSGDLLLELRRPAEALVTYEKNPAKEPNRLRSVYGATRAAELAGDALEAQPYDELVAAICARADTPNRREVRAALLFPQKR